VVVEVIRRHQLVDPVDGMPLGDPCQDLLEVGLRVDAVELRRSHERVDGRCPLAAAIRAGEQIVASSERNFGVILPMSGLTSLFTTGGTRFVAVVSAPYIKRDEAMAM
jgi:hypothetical protein